MPSVVGLLEQRELTARRRVDVLREEADRIQAELVAAEREWNEWVIARSRVGEVLSPGEGDTVGPDAAEEPSDRGDPPALSACSEAAKPKSVVPMWRAGPAWSVLSVDYPCIVRALADRGPLGQGPLPPCPDRHPPRTSAEQRWAPSAGRPRRDDPTPPTALTGSR
ncbi:hypothetical protein [Kitasatospora griseola]|uniref:hypothetical protein n=1 Tax=Kitasatospora griseola TaxID=2064 RepID=UPI0038110D25